MQLTKTGSAVWQRRSRDFARRFRKVDRSFHNFHSPTLTDDAIMQVLISESEIHAGIARLGKRIHAAAQGQPLLVVGIMTGSVVFLADLIRRLEMPVRVGLVQASSYRGATTTGAELHLNAAWLPDVAGQDVLLLDDIFDTGRTLSAVVDLVKQGNPRCLQTAVLLRKTGRQQVTYEPDHSCFEIPDHFVVGYGLDYNDEYRHLPYIATLEPHDLPSRTVEGKRYDFRN